MHFVRNKTHLFYTYTICQLVFIAFSEMCLIDDNFIFEKSLRNSKTRFIFASAIETQAIIITIN